jgi:hypothetical protein
MTTVRHLRAAWPAMRELFAEQPAPRTSLNCRVGADRDPALIRGDLDQVKTIAHSHDTKINDVLRPSRPARWAIAKRSGSAADATGTPEVSMFHRPPAAIAERRDRAERGRTERAQAHRQRDELIG